jgi:hypothetical protein
MTWPGPSVVVDDASTFKLVAVTWLFFLVIGVGLLLAGTLVLPLVIGTFPEESPVKTTEVFFRKQCDNDVCMASATMPDNGYWAASLMVFWVSIALLAFAMGLIVFALCSSVLHIDLAKTVSSVAHTLLLVGWLLLVVGLGDLGNMCTSAEIQCNLECMEGVGNEFSPFYICDPWVGGTGMWSLFSGTAILFFSSFLAFALKLKKVSAAPVTHPSIRPTVATAVSSVQSPLYTSDGLTPRTATATARNVVYQRATNNRQTIA